MYVAVRITGKCNVCSQGVMPDNHMPCGDGCGVESGGRPCAQQAGQALGDVPSLAVLGDGCQCALIVHMRKGVCADSPLLQPPCGFRMRAVVIRAALMSGGSAVPDPLGGCG